MKKKSILVLMIALGMLLCGCTVKKGGGSDKQAVDFTVMEKEGIPQELATMIADKQTEAFTLSYSMEDYTYLAMGYGQQATGGYSIRVDEVYETDMTVGMHTTLIGPSAGEAVNKMASYPYIVVKIEHTDKNVVFE